MAFTAPISVPVSAPLGTPARLMLCDYASSGNTWSRESTFKVWLPQPLHLPVQPPLTGSNWIWFGGDQGVPSTQYAPAIEFPAGERYFRRTFVVPAGLRTATLSLTADDRFIVYVNGKEAAHSAHWNNVTTLDLHPFLDPAHANVVAVQAVNESASPAGLIASLRLITDAGAVNLLTDTTWKSASTAPPHWQGFRLR